MTICFTQGFAYVYGIPVFFLVSIIYQIVPFVNR